MNRIPYFEKRPYFKKERRKKPMFIGKCSECLFCKADSLGIYTCDNKEKLLYYGTVIQDSKNATCEFGAYKNLDVLQAHRDFIKAILSAFENLNEHPQYGSITVYHSLVKSVYAVCKVTSKVYAEIWHSRYKIFNLSLDTIVLLEKDLDA